MDILKSKKSKPKIKLKGSNNKLNIETCDLNKFKEVIINISGNNNTINILPIADKYSSGIIIITINGSNSSVNIDEGLHITSKLHININNISETTEELEDVHVKIGKNNYIEDLMITTYQSHNNITIGDNCLFSSGINLYNTDGHPIYNSDTGLLCNYVKDMKIGNNCWIGKDATILKNVELPEGTIVGWGSIVAKSINKECCAVAGNPAKIVKEKVTWKRNGDKDSVKNIKP